MVDVAITCSQWRICHPARWGDQHKAIAPGGPMDQLSAECTHACCGHDEPGGICEWPLYPLKAYFNSNGAIACGGSPRELFLNGERIERYVPYVVGPGDVLEAGPAYWGVYGYLAITGGFEGMTEGGAYCGYQKYGAARSVRPMRQWWPRRGFVRCIPGPEWHDSLRELVNARWRISSLRDEAGMRLVGPPVPPGFQCNIRSGPVSTGVVQLTEAGPIVLLSGRATHGGYARADGL